MRFSSYGPTKLLFLYLCEQEMARFHTRHPNLSAGESRYKREFCNRIVDNLHLTAVNPQPLSQLRYVLWALPRQGKTAISQALSKVRYIQRPD